MQKKRTEPKFCPLKRGYILLEVTLQQTLQSLAVTGPVLGEFSKSLYLGAATIL